jgi:peptidoglycan hydrolase-like protein with peptidoglycan-binding domain
VLPQVVRSYGNGKIPRELLVPCGIRNFTMVEPAARACRAMVAAAAAAGIRLDATGTYRTYERQEQMFRERYSKTPIEGRRTKTWNGVRYWQKPGTAMAAVPGTSRHGLGVTADLAQRSASGRLEPVGSATLEWLAAHGPEFGFWNSVRSEPWHWPYFPGDDLPDVVLRMEQEGVIRLQPDVPTDPAEREAFYRELPYGGVLSKGSSGAGVEAVQWALTRNGIATGIDGAFGPATERSVREFQRANDLTVDGLVGSNTWSALGLLSEDRRPREDVSTPPAKPAKQATATKPAKQATATKPAKQATATKPAKQATATKQTAPQRGAVAAAAAAYRAGFRGDDLATITMIAGRESGWQSDRKNPRTSDRGMWQINWKNLQRKGYADLRARLGITSDADLLDLDTNAAVAYFMYEDANRAGEPWFPWRASDRGHDGSGPGWDGKGSHLWRTEKFAAEATAAATAVLDSGGSPKLPAAKPTEQDAGATTDTGAPAEAHYTIVAGDADGLIAVVARCLGIVDAPWSLRLAAAEAVAAHNGVDLEHVWLPGDTLRVPPEIDGVRCYVVRPGDGPIAISKGLGLGRSAAAQRKVAEINAWHGGIPHAGAVWYGGPA